MKNMKRLFALLVAIMILVAGVAAYATDASGEVPAADTVTITLSRDESYDGEGDREYTYYKVFDAEYTGTGAAPDAVTYTLAASDQLVARLGTWNDSTKTWTRAEGQLWFDLTKTVDGTKYVVTATDAMTTSANAQAAAEWLLTNGNLTGHAMTWNAEDENWTSGEVAKGYYIVSGSEGKNLVAATTDIDIAEKNTYPTIDKKQKKANGTWTDDPLPKEIGKIIEYQVTVTVPVDANKNIAVFDKMSAGLEFIAPDGENTDGLTVTPAAATYTAITSTTDHAQYDADNTWQIKFSDDVIKAIAATGTEAEPATITITYKARVTAAALTDSTKENDVTLDYDNHHYYVPDHVNYELYTTGAVKYDGATADVNDNNALVKDEAAQKIAYLQGAEFKLQVQVGKTGDWADLAVVANDDGTYRPLNAAATPAETAATITSNAKGEIIIRGLDKDNAYRLIETKAPDGGYNLLATEAALNVTTKDDKAKVALKPDGDAADDTTYIDNAATELSTKIANNKGSQLPSTGGIGTTIFYVGGSILVIAAVILLVTKRRMSNHD